MDNRKTVKSLALLKVMLDRNENLKSYMDLFIPMVIELMKKRKIKNFGRNEISNVIQCFYNEYGLKIPYHPMVTIINRMIQEDYLKTTSVRQHEPIQFTPNYDKIDQTEYDISSKKFDAEFDIVVQEYVKFANKKHSIRLTEDQAYDHIILVLKDHDLDIAFMNQEGTSILPSQEDGSNLSKNLFYDFVRTLFEEKSQNLELVNEIVFGYIIASALLFTEIKPVKTIKRKTTYYLDTGILFGLLGINSNYEQEVFSDFIYLLQEKGGVVKIFEHTYQEFINIIDSCVEWIDNPNYDPNKASRALLFFKSEGYHRSDIELFIKQLPEKIKSFGIEIEDIPDPNINTNFQMDEEEFQRKLIDLYRENNPNFDEEEKEGTINYDVKSVSAVFKQRGGKVARNIEECKFLFVTTNSTLAFASKLHENNYPLHDTFYIPTTVTDVFLGTILWLSSPNYLNLEDFSKKHLISHCYAALNPTKQQFTLFLNEVNKLKQDGSLTEDDITYLETSPEARRLLQEKTLGDAMKITSKTPIEILQEIQSEAERKAKEKFTPIQTELEKRNKELIEELRQNKEEIDKKEKQYIELSNKLKEEVKKEVNTFSIILIVFFIIIFVFLQIIDENLITININNNIKIAIKWISLFISIVGIVFDINIKQCKNKKVNEIVAKKLLKKYNITSKNNKGY